MRRPATAMPALLSRGRHRPTNGELLGTSFFSLHNWERGFSSSDPYSTGLSISSPGQLRNLVANSCLPGSGNRSRNPACNDCSGPPWRRSAGEPILLNTRPRFARRKAKNRNTPRTPPRMGIRRSDRTGSEGAAGRPRIGFQAPPTAILAPAAASVMIVVAKFTEWSR